MVSNTREKTQRLNTKLPACRHLCNDPFVGMECSNNVSQEAMQCCDTTNHSYCDSAKL